MHLTPALVLALHACTAPAGPPGAGGGGAAETGEPPPGHLDSGRGDSGPDSGEGSPEDTAAPGLFASLLTVREVTSASLSCWSPQEPCFTPQADLSCVRTRSLQGTVAELSSGAPLGGAEVALFWGSDAVGEPDATMIADEAGGIGGEELLSCAEQIFRISGPGLAPTLVSERIHPPGEEAAEVSLLAPSEEGLAALWAAQELTPDPAQGAAYGRVLDCAGRPAERLQVVVRRQDEYPATQLARYFVEGMPAPDQPYTSSDGLWMVAGLLPGRYDLELWGVVPGIGLPMMLSEADVEVLAGGLSELELQIGIAGPVYPEICLEACE